MQSNTPQLALDLIQEAKEKRLTRLDLGRTGLTVLPIEILELEHLEDLILSDEIWCDKEISFENSPNKGPGNKLSILPEWIVDLKQLKTLRIGGIIDQKLNISNIQLLEKLTGLQTLDLSNSYICDYSFFEQMTGLHTLFLVDTFIPDYRCLEKMEGLKFLYLRYNNIEDSSPLSSLKKLEYLDLGCTEIDDYHFLEKLSHLQTLDLDSVNTINDYSFLGKLTWLKKLLLSINQVKDYSFLKKMSNLQTLDLNCNKLKDLHFLESLTNLQSLYLHHNQINDIRPLKKLINLRSLKLNGHIFLGINHISDISILEHLTNLKKIEIGDNQIRKIPSFEKFIDLEYVDLSYNHISDIPSFRKFAKLEFVNLRNNQIKGTFFFSHPISLKSLDLSSNKIQYFDSAENLKGLKNLKLTSNQVSDISFLEKLSELQSLDLSHNQISDISILEKLPELQSLDLSRNQISDISILEKLPKLQSLVLKDNQVSDISVLRKLPNLQSLNLANNQISDISVLKKLLELQSLDLENAPLSDMSVLEHLIKLEYLNLNNNQISDICVLKKLSNLRTLNLKANQISHIDLEWLQSMPNLWTLDIAGNPIKHIPKDIYDKGGHLEKIKDYLLAIAEGQVKNMEAKILLIGNGRVGKTCISKRLLYNTFNPHEISTHSIQIEQWNTQDLQFHLWDFGGQDIYHGTHQLFMRTRALYLLVWDWKSEYIESKNQDEQDNEFDNHPLDYWLNYWKTLSDHSPILIIRNKMDDGTYQAEELPSREEQYFAEKYGLDSSNFIKVSAATGDGFEDLKTVILEKAQQMTALQELIPSLWEEARQKIRDLQSKGQKTLYSDDYSKICKEVGVSLISETSARSLREFLHATGCLFYHKDLPSYQIILDQAWAIKAFYTLFDRNGFYFDLLMNKKGKFRKADLLEYWQGYNQTEQELFISFLKSCRIIFEVYKEKQVHDYFVVPQLLPETLDEHQRHLWNKVKVVYYFKYKYDFLRQEFFSQFLTKIGLLTEAQVMWRQGILLNQAPFQFLIERHPSEKMITIQVAGKNALDLLELIRNSFMGIHRTFQYKRWVSFNGEDWILLNNLPRYSDKKIKTNTDKWVDYEPFKVFLSRKTIVPLEKMHLDELISPNLNK